MDFAVSKPEHVMDPSRLSLAEVYAEGLISLLDDEEVDQVDQELLMLERMLEQIEDFEAMICYSLISSRERRTLVERIFHGRCDDSVYALLQVLARHNRLPMLRMVCRRFHKLHERRHGRVDVEVTTAVELTRPEQERLAESLGRSLQIRPILNLAVDKSLLGGMVVRVGDRLFDASLATQLRRVRRKLAGRIAQQV